MGIRITVATLRMVTPTQPTSAWRSMSAEHDSAPLPPVEGCGPAVIGPAQLATTVPSPGAEKSPAAWTGVIADAGSALYLSVSGAWIARSSAASIV
jgi:hypothetical protein